MFKNPTTDVILAVLFVVCFVVPYVGVIRRVLRDRDLPLLVIVGAVLFIPLGGWLAFAWPRRLNYDVDKALDD